MNGRVLSLPLTLPVAAVGGMAVAHVGGFGGRTEIWRVVLALVYALVVILAPWRSERPARGLAVAAVLASVVAVWWSLQAPSADRPWAEAASRTPRATIDGDLVTIHDVRNFRWKADDAWVADWYDATYDVSRIEGGDFILTRFTEMEGIAHVMAGFRFSDDRFLNLSVEIRREEGETYDPIGGLFRQYEVMMVAADERDTLGLRTLVWNDPTWVFPLSAGPEKTGEFFLDMVARMNELHEEPEWYNTLTNSCSTSLAAAYERVARVRLPVDWRIVLPGYSDRVVEELGLLEDGLTAGEARARYAVNELARDAGLGEGFSSRIRGREPVEGPRGSRGPS